MNRGMVHLYMGDGKGKTTAAAGLAARALGQGLRVGFCQFLKNGKSGECLTLEKAGALFIASSGSSKFIWEMSEPEKAACKAGQQQALAQAAAMMPRLDVLVLDEALGALETGMLELEEIVVLVRQKPSALELVLTGRNAPLQLMELADYATEMRCIKHPFSQGVPARKGIEY